MYHPPVVLPVMLMAMLSPPTAPEPGVPRALAEERARRITDLRYQLKFHIPAVVNEPVTGVAVIRFVLAAASAPIFLDFAPPAANVRRVTVGGREMPVDWTNEHLVLPAASLRAGENEVAVDFVAADASLNRNADFLYTLFVPGRARFAFPCFDQPDLKARFTLTLDLSSGLGGAHQRR